MKTKDINKSFLPSIPNGEIPTSRKIYVAVPGYDPGVAPGMQSAEALNTPLDNPAFPAVFPTHLVLVVRQGKLLIGMPKKIAGNGDTVYQTLPW